MGVRKMIQKIKKERVKSVDLLYQKKGKESVGHHLP